MQQTPRITYSSGKNERGKTIYKLSHNVCVQTNQGQQLNGNEFISLDNEGLLAIREDYSWNGMTWFWDTNEIMFPTLVHDALYQLMRIDYGNFSNENRIEDRSKFRKDADKLFYRHCRQNRVNCVKALICYIGVWVAGSCFSKVPKKYSYNVDDVTAPANGSVKCR